jgi:hypothetical protein
MKTESCPPVELFARAVSEDGAALSDHLKSCESCRAQWTEMQELRTLAGALPFQAPSAERVEAVERALTARNFASGSGIRKRNRLVAAASAFAIAAAVAIFLRKVEHELALPELNTGTNTAPAALRESPAAPAPSVQVALSSSITAPAPPAVPSTAVAAPPEVTAQDVNHPEPLQRRTHPAESAAVAAQQRAAKPPENAASVLVPSSSAALVASGASSTPPSQRAERDEPPSREPLPAVPGATNAPEKTGQSAAALRDGTTPAKQPRESRETKSGGASEDRRERHEVREERREQRQERRERRQERRERR